LPKVNELRVLADGRSAPGAGAGLKWSRVSGARLVNRQSSWSSVGKPKAANRSRAASRDAFSEERQAARSECEAAFARIEERSAEAHQTEATWRELGLELARNTSNLALEKWALERRIEIAPRNYTAWEELAASAVWLPLVTRKAYGWEFTTRAQVQSRGEENTLPSDERQDATLLSVCPLRAQTGQGQGLGLGIEARGATLDYPHGPGS